ncbi:AAA family ATPase [Geobacter sulfurreducens]|uniref:Carbon monoxide dehydrogenase accessory protein CooC n=2 Tax=Geobacter sulfurreducens TaxID=35554 RepID=Q74BE4_GEOSL|nr:AAA family ATPase [Geobacter sulfurreducens]AAR35473.2 carbon monoxide dehydrogenase accessory protein CooC [Geobacter sulfurreducens PCA]ADI84932.2 carbon monoxide dehydrogenase accessory protein CooC [Geobacter sulfurreducens KN400]AJY68322.1 carbon monoxide dehydrogenase [Geobacter sulfurreducens]QVW34036.1 AAA family ATPase [Geobacter sulfurreducens]UAC02823.1 AAA family ATPase [Geobacter sulfurreducens]
MCQPQSPGMRVVITGKGGVGKTTLTSCLATVLAGAGTHVLAVDEDPQMNLPNALGVPYEEAAGIVPLNRHADYIEEKTGIRPGRNGWGALFKLNPDVDDVVSRLGLKVAENLSLLVMGTVKQAGGGCLCAENVLLDATIRHLALRMNEAILLDTQAGMEHFGRSLAKGFGQCVVVADSSFNALSVALQSAALARESGIGLVHLAVNRVTGDDLRLERFQRETGQSLPDIFDRVVQLPAEPLLQTLDPHVARIMADRHSGYAAAVTRLASVLCSPPCPCASPRDHARHHHHAH